MRIGFSVGESSDSWSRSVGPQKALTTLLTVSGGHIVTATGGHFVRTTQTDPALKFMKGTGPKKTKKFLEQAGICFDYYILSIFTKDKKVAHAR